MVEIKVRKRNGDSVDFDIEKIKSAVSKAHSRTNEDIEKLEDKVARYVKKHLPEQESITVDEIHKLVENGIMNSKAFDTAREYVTYRKEHEPDIFRERKNYKPFEYPHLKEYMDAIHRSFWVVDEFSLTSDIQEYHVDLTEHEKQVIQRTMLAISQIEARFVKTFWGRVYDRLPKPEIADVGATFSDSECHIEGTEVLTPKGWVDFKDINVGDQVMQYDPKTEKTTVTDVKHVVNEEYKGKIHTASKNKLEFHVTPNHRFAYKARKDGIIKEKMAGDINVWHSNIKLPTTTSLDGVHDELTYKERLYIAIQADGTERFWRNTEGKRINRGLSSNCHTYDISLIKDRKIQRLIDILDNVGFTYRRYKDSDRGHAKFEVDVPIDEMPYSLKTFDWVDLTDKNVEYCENFIQELVEWDGCRLPHKKDGKMRYSTTVKACADIVQMIGTMAGYNTRINTYVDNRKETFKDCYTVSFVTQPPWVGTNMKSEVYDYEGTIHCVTVDSGYIITRYNDTVLISGNSRHATSYSQLLEYLGMNEIFERLDDFDCLRKRQEYLKAFVSPKDASNKEYTKSILMFSMFIENVSLFSQFLIMSSFDKYRNQLTGISNIVQSTSADESVHALFGAELINIIRQENPEWFDDELIEETHEACRVSMKAESDIVDWIFESGDLEFITAEEVKDYLRWRFNQSMEMIDYPDVFEVRDSTKDKFQWFEMQVNSTTNPDFFARRNVNYTKVNKSFDKDELF